VVAVVLILGCGSGPMTTEAGSSGSVAPGSMVPGTRAVEPGAMETAVEVTKAIPAGTTGEVAISQDMIASRDLPAKYLPESRVRRPDEVQGLVAHYPIAAGSVLVPGMFVAPGAPDSEAAAVEDAIAFGPPCDPPNIKGTAGITMDPVESPEAAIRVADPSSLLGLPAHEWKQVIVQKAVAVFALDEDGRRRALVWVTHTDGREAGWSIA
jgi:hypothetical protein